jgi:glycine dehydrogenase
MLAALGYTSLDELCEAAIPADLHRRRPLDLPPARSEPEVLEALRRLAGRNRRLRSLIGLGYHDTHLPGVIQRNVLESPAWYTAYTPYQPEISQGRLEVLLNFQTMVADLVGMDLANASLLDEPTAAAEAMAMCRRLQRGEGGTFLVDRDTHPHTRAVLATRAAPLGIELVDVDPTDPAALEATEGTAFGLLVQHPGSSGEVRDLAPVIEAAHARGLLVVAATDLLACCLLRPPGELGADLVVGSAQRFGVPLGYGGPHAAFLACRDQHRRSLPGRLVGVSVDAAGRPALRLALQTREQHIRREKATSNICTAQVLLAVIAGLYACWHGPEGLAAIAARVRDLTAALAAGLGRLGPAGVRVHTRTFFDTLTVSTGGRAGAVLEAARARGLNLRPVDDDRVGISLDETCDGRVVAEVLDAFADAVAATGAASGSPGGPSGSRRPPDPAAPAATGAGAPPAPPLPDHARRTSAYLTHPVFHRHRSETAMLRYLRRLADRDLALDRTMIPLGSCTMKLNATTEMTPVTWPEFSGLHPFAPLDQAGGYRELFADLERWLAELTGYDAVSLQPNAGSQGELAGLLAIRAWQAARGEGQRDVCLIPASAHGTNAASAVMAGLQVVVVGTDPDGNVDLADLAAKAEENADRLCALMITYPSTHGVFEPTLRQVCRTVHDHGGQVYLDGANLNALVGLAAPGELGADVSHLNLHKTFCIPHGGGGPGVGPVAVKAHLAPYLPSHPLVPEAGPPGGGIGAISGAPWGSAGILPISWAYVALMGPDGLRRATQVAILSANYVAARLADHYPVLYTGPGGLVAHECILDLRPITAATGVTVDDVAKRLIDYGFHAPTVSFPVAGTLMVEPTESEDLAELDRFCDAMIAIRDEIRRVEAGEWPLERSPLRLAPHTVDDLAAEPWDRPYPRALGVRPDPGRDRYFPPVARIDAAYGDRHVVCSCPPIEAYAAGPEAR